VPKQICIMKRQEVSNPCLCPSTFRIHVEKHIAEGLTVIKTLNASGQSLFQNEDGFPSLEDVNDDQVVEVYCVVREALKLEFNYTRSSECSVVGLLQTHGQCKVTTVDEKRDMVVYWAGFLVVGASSFTLLLNLRSSSSILWSSSSS
jgi:hypothetical protein